MSNANEPAYPAIETRPAYDDERNLYAETYSVGGLTKREYFAAMAMNGLLAGEYRDTSDRQLETVSVWAVKHADALLAELERTKC